MFLRCKVRRKDGKQHRYWSVVENTRVAGGRVVQRHVLALSLMPPLAADCGESRLPPQGTTGVRSLREQTSKLENHISPILEI